MRRHIKLTSIVTGMLSAFVLMVAPVGAVTNVVYDNIPDPQPANLPSQAFEATGTSEFGGQIQLAGTQRTNLNLKVLLSSWGCENGAWYTGDCQTTPGVAFSHPITANVYAVNADNTPGALVATSTKTFSIPYRPSVSPECTEGRWSPNQGADCYNGLGVPIVFNQWSTNTTWPDKVIVSIAYNTSHYGYAPIGEAPCVTEPGGCGYDSLNVGLTAPATVGSMPVPDDAYLNSKFGSQYCDNGAGGTDSFRYDAGCWTGYQPAYEVYGMQAAQPTTKDQCKNEGWKTLVDKNGQTFKNQGLCVSSVVSNR